MSSRCVFGRRQKGLAGSRREAIVWQRGHGTEVSRMQGALDSGTKTEVSSSLQRLTERAHGESGRISKIRWMSLVCFLAGCLAPALWL